MSMDLSMEMVDLIMGVGYLILFGAVIAAFLGHIMIVNSLAISVAAGLLAFQFGNATPAVSFALAALLFLVLIFIVQKTKLGFFIISISMSLFWGILLFQLTRSQLGDNLVLTAVVLLLYIGVMAWMHMRARK